MDPFLVTWMSPVRRTWDLSVPLCIQGKFVQNLFIHIGTFCYNCNKKGKSENIYKIYLKYMGDNGDFMKKELSVAFVL